MLPIEEIISFHDSLITLELKETKWNADSSNIAWNMAIILLIIYPLYAATSFLTISVFVYPCKFKNWKCVSTRRKYI